MNKDNFDYGGHFLGSNKLPLPHLLYQMSKEDRETLGLTLTHFNIHFNTSRKYNSVYEVIVDIVGKKCLKEVWCIITNTARALSYKASGYYVSKDVRTYSGNKQKISATKMSRLLDTLTEKGYLTYYKGGVVSFKNETYVTSAYTFTNQFLALWNAVDVSGEEDTFDLVQIRDRETKELRSLAFRKGVGEMMSVLTSYNKILRDTDISLYGKVIPVQQYARIFSDTLTKGGRYYNTVGGIQTMVASKRKDLVINQEVVSELDFKALHPSILYDKAWQDDPDLIEDWWDDEYDPYKAQIDFLNVDVTKIAHMRESYNSFYDPVRNLVKFAVLVSLNARDLIGAYCALAQEFYTDKKKWENNLAGSKYYGIMCPTNKDGNDMFPAKAICEAAQAANYPIKEYFFADAGVELQYVDSEIVAYVLTAMVAEGQVMFSEHDSIIAPVSCEDRVRQLMQEGYERVVGSSKFCVIERK